MTQPKHLSPTHLCCLPYPTLPYPTLPHLMLRAVTTANLILLVLGYAHDTHLYIPNDIVQLIIDKCYKDVF